VYAVTLSRRTIFMDFLTFLFLFFLILCALLSDRISTIVLFQAINMALASASEVGRTASCLRLIAYEAYL